MSKIRQRIGYQALQELAGPSGITENSELKTVNKIQIVDNRINLSDKGFGDVLFNMALLFDSADSDIILYEATCMMGNDGTYVIFDAADNLNGKFAIFSYLGRVND